MILTLFTLIDYSIHDETIYIETISVELSICILWGCPSKFLKHIVFLYLKIVFILENIEDPLCHYIWVLVEEIGTYIPA